MPGYNCRIRGLTPVLPVANCYVTHSLDQRSLSGVRIVMSDTDEHGAGEREDLRTRRVTCPSGSLSGAIET